MYFHRFFSVKLLFVTNELSGNTTIFQRVNGCIFTFVTNELSGNTTIFQRVNGFLHLMPHAVLQCTVLGTVYSSEDLFFLQKPELLWCMSAHNDLSSHLFFFNAIFC
jgi:hypothetical protein